ncbi:Thioredoxin-like domain containing protein [Naviculisporaceae sp. PSN 640]
MKQALLHLGRVLFIVASTIPWSVTVAGWEHVQDPESFGQAIKEDHEVLVAFVDQSPKSVSLEVEWLSAAAERKETLISVDCVTNRALCDSHQVKSYPSIILFKSGGVVATYHGPRRATSILQFVSLWKVPDVSNLRTIEDLETFKAAVDVAFVAFLKAGDDDSAADFTQVLVKYRGEFPFGIVTDPSVAESQDVKTPAIVCYRSIDGEKLVTSDLKSDKLDGWVKESSRQVLGDLTVLNQQRLIERGWPMVYLFAQTEDQRRELRTTIYKFAKNYYDSLTSVIVDPLEFPELMGKLGLEEGRFPAGAVHQLSKDRVYPFPKDMPLTPNAIQKWGLDVYQGRIKPWTPPGVTTTYEDLGPTKVATRKASIRSIPGVKIRVAGHDEL